MSEVSIRADHRGLTVDVTVATAGTADDYALVLNRALKAIGAALATEATYTEPFDQDATQAMDEVPYR